MKDTRAESAPAPAGEAAALQRSCAELGLTCSPQQQHQLLTYIDVLSQWNAVHNLTALRSRAEILTHHVADCLAAIGPVSRRLALRAVDGRRARVLDVGSGGGLPGLVIAAMLPDVDVTCVDSVGKKAAFIRQAALSMALWHVTVAHARVEALKAPPFDLIVSRAFASLDRFITLTQPLLESGGCWMAMKGKTPSDEIDMLDASRNMFHVEQLAVPGLDADRCVVWIEPN